MTTNIASTLTIRISERSGSYYIEASGLGVDVKSLSFKWTPSKGDLEIIGLLHSEPAKVLEEQLIALGQTLYKSVFTPEILLVYDRSNKKLKSGDGIRIRLIIEAKNLSHIPWEVMHDGQDFISLYSEYPIVRGTRESFHVRQSAVSGPIRILYVWSEPKDLPPLNLRTPAEEIRMLVGQNRRIKFEILPNASVISLRKALLSQYNVICFAGHGTESHIYLETQTGHDKLSAKELARELEGRPVQLVFLAACKTAGTPSEGLASFAHTLANETQIPAIAAMQYEISDDQANLLAARYFETIANFRPLDVALAESRKALLKERKVLRDVFAPVIYLQSKTSNLFHRARNWLAIGFAVFAIIAMGLAAVFGGQIGIFALNAQKQEKIALANQLTAQAQPIYITGDSRQELSILLAVQSMKIYPSVQSSQLLLSNSLAIPIITESLVKPLMSTNLNLNSSPISISFSPDSKYFITAADSTARVWDIDTEREVSNLYHGNTDVSFIRFTPDGKRVVSVGNRTIHIWDPRTGHENTPITLDNQIKSIDVSSDGKYIVVGSYQTAYVLDIATGEIVSQKNYESGSIRNVVFSPNGKIVGLSTYDSMFNIWDTTNGKEIASMQHNASVTHLAFSPNGKLILSTGDIDNDRKSIVRIWDTNSYEEIVNLTQNSLILSVAFSPDSKYIVTGCADNVARVWEVATGKEISKMIHDSKVLSVEFSPDSKYVISGSDDNTARVWEVATGKETARMTHKDAVFSVAFSPNGKHVGSGSSDNTARMWEPIARNEIANTTVNGNLDFDAISPDRKLVAARTNSDHILHVWEVISRKEISQFIHNDDVSSIAISPNNKYIAFGGRDGIVLINDISTGQEISRMMHELPEGYSSAAVISVAFSPNSKYLASGSNDNTARVWGVATGKEIARVAYDDFENVVSSVAFSPNGKYVVSGTYGLGMSNQSVNPLLRVWEANTGKEISHMSALANSVVFNSDGTYIAVASPEANASIWEVSTGKRITFMSHNDTVSLVAFSPDQKFLATGSYDNTARVWNISTGEEVSRMTHDGKLNSIAFSPDGRYVVSGSDDKTARVWEANTGKEIVRVIHNNPVYSVNFNQNGKYVLSGSIDKLHTWKWKPEDLIADACSRITRNLTRAEWKQYIGNVMPFQAVCLNLLLETEFLPTEIN